MSKTNTTSTLDDLEQKHRFEANRKYFIISIYAVCVIVLSVISIYVLWNMTKVASIFDNFIHKLSPFIVAFFIAYFMNPLVKFIHNKIMSGIFKIKNNKVNIGLSILFAYIFVITCITLILLFILPEVYYSILDLTETISKNIPKWSNKIIQTLESLEAKFPWFNWDTIEKQAKNSIPSFMKITTNLVTYIFEKAINISISVISTVLSLIVSITVSIYMILDKHILAKHACRFTYAIIPKNKAQGLIQTIKECNNIFYNFVMGKALDSIIIFVITFIAMNIFNLEFALIISIFVGITNMIPYFGPFIGAIPGIIILLIVAPIDGIIFSILILIIQQFDGIYLGPKILGDSVGIKPLWVIFGITIGGAYGGPFGMFVGVPLTAIASYLINKVISSRLLQKNVTANDFKKVGL